MISQLTAKLKSHLRDQIRKQRQLLTDTDLEQADLQLCQQYLEAADKLAAKKIALYLQHDNELGTNHLIKLLLDKGCHLYIPKLYTDASHQLHFCRFHLQSELLNNRYGIAEPVNDEFISIDELEVIFLPLTAFDQQGNRLGMGGGYYDRTLARRTHTRAILVGLAYDFQEVADCPVEPYDQAVDMLITPTRVIDFRK